MPHRFWLVRDTARRRNEQIVLSFRVFNNQTLLLVQKPLFPALIQNLLNRSSVRAFPQVPVHIQKFQPELLPEQVAPLALPSPRHAYQGYVHTRMASPASRIYSSRELLYFPIVAKLFIFARCKNAFCAAGIFSAFPFHVLSAVRSEE